MLLIVAQNRINTLEGSLKHLAFLTELTLYDNEVHIATALHLNTTRARAGHKFALCVRPQEWHKPSQESVCVSPPTSHPLVQGSAGCQSLPTAGQHCVRADYQWRMCLFLQLRDLHAMLPYLKHLKFLKSLDMRYPRFLAARVEHT